MGKKRQVDAFNAILVIFGIALLVISIIFIAILSNDPVVFKINLQEKNVTRGQKVVLYYEISNWWPKEITDIKVNAKMESAGDATRQSFNYSSAGFLDKISGAYVQDTGWIEEGDYVVKVNTTYYSPSGKLESKELSLGIAIK